MLIRAGFNLAFECPGVTPMLLTIHVRPERQIDIREPEKLTVFPYVPYTTYRDQFGNICTRLDAPTGRLSLWNRFLIEDTGQPDAIPSEARQHPVNELPNDTLVYLLGSLYCDTHKLVETAWSLFEAVPPGWPRVKAIMTYTHHRVKFGYEHARAHRTASEANEERVGVCRDYAHLAIALCRCMNIPARYCTGYLGDIGVPHDPSPMDFSAWFEVYLGGAWHTVDARHNKPRIGRILMARGRDATDAAISTAFGIAKLVEFTVFTDRVTS